MGSVSAIAEDGNTGNVIVTVQDSQVSGTGTYFTTIFFFNATAPTEIYTPLYTLSLHDALPISPEQVLRADDRCAGSARRGILGQCRSEEHTSELQSHSGSSYAVFCLKKKQ